MDYSKILEYMLEANYNKNGEERIQEIIELIKAKIEKLLTNDIYRRQIMGSNDSFKELILCYFADEGRSESDKILELYRELMLLRKGQEISKKRKQEEEKREEEEKKEEEEKEI